MQAAASVTSRGALDRQDWLPRAERLHQLRNFHRASTARLEADRHDATQQTPARFAAALTGRGSWESAVAKRKSEQSPAAVGPIKPSEAEPQESVRSHVRAILKRLRKRSAHERNPTEADP
jgi:hypothetical protein